MYTIRRVHKINTVLTNYTSLKLSDPTGSFGLRTYPGGTVVVADGIDFVNDSTGTYHYSVDLDVGQYEYWVERTYAGETKYDQKIISVTGVVEIGNRFLTYSEFEARWGGEVIRVASNKSKTSIEPDYEAVAMAFAYSEEEIDSGMAGGVYLSPLDFTPNSDAVPSRVKEWASIISMEYLYRSRGQPGTSTQKGQKDERGIDIAAQLKAVKMEMGFVFSGVPGYRLPAAMTSDPFSIGLTRVRDVIVSADYYFPSVRYPDQQAVYVW